MAATVWPRLPMPLRFPSPSLGQETPSSHHQHRHRRLWDSDDAGYLLLCNSPVDDEIIVRVYLSISIKVAVPKAAEPLRKTVIDPKVIIRIDLAIKTRITRPGNDRDP